MPEDVKAQIHTAIDLIKDGKEIQKMGIEEEIRGLNQLDDIVENTDLKFLGPVLKAYTYAGVIWQSEAKLKKVKEEPEEVEWQTKTGDWRPVKEGRNDEGHYFFSCPAIDCDQKATYWVAQDSHIREKHTKETYKCALCYLWESTNFDSVKRHEKMCAALKGVDVPRRKKDM